MHVIKILNKQLEKYLTYGFMIPKSINLDFLFYVFKSIGKVFAFDEISQYKVIFIFLHMTILK